MALTLALVGCSASHPGTRSVFDAVKEDDYAWVEAYLKSGGDPNAADENGETLLCWALAMQSASCAESLVEHGADVNLEEQTGTPLRVAVGAPIPSLRIMGLLIDNGAAIDGTVTVGITPLHLAAANLDLDVAEFLLRSGASRDAVTAQAKTPHALALEAWAEDVRYRTSSAKELIPGISDEMAANLDKLAAESRRSPEELRQWQEDVNHLISLLEPRE